MIELAPEPLKLDLRSGSDQGDAEISVNLDSTSVSVAHSQYRIPFFIPHEQAYYWTHEWQQGIQRSMADLEAGNYTDFSPDDPGR
jgi:hypothetical protein